MLRIEHDDGHLIRLERTALQPTQLPPASEIRTLVLASADEFVADFDSSLRLLESDLPIRETETPRSDLICTHKDGTIVVLVLPRDGQEQLATALAMSGQLAHWDTNSLTRRLTEGQRAELVEFLSGSLDTLNHRQRLVLVSGAVDPNLTSAVEWLSTGGIPVSLYELHASKDAATEDVYLSLGSPGQQVESVSIIRDVTPKRTELDLAAKERELGAIAECLTKEETERRLADQIYQTVSRLAPIGIFHTDPEGNYLFVNERWCEITGLNSREALGKGWIEALHPEDRERVLLHWESTLGQHQRFKTEFRFLRADGVSWVLADAAALTGASGTFGGVAGTVTELHRSRFEQRNEPDSSSSPQ